MDGNQGVNAFANDGSFMEIFRRKMEEERRTETEVKDRRKPASETNVTTDETSSKSKTNAMTNSGCGQQPEQLHEKLTKESVGSDSSTSSREAGKDLTTEKVTECDTEAHQSCQTSQKQSQQAREVDNNLRPRKPTPCTSQAPIPKKYSVLSHVGKRRGGKLALKTGAVKKPKTAETQGTGANDAWSKYMAEVEKYKAHVCGDEDKSRPLVK